MNLPKFIATYHDDASARALFEAQRWPDIDADSGRRIVSCPHCSHSSATMPRLRDKRTFQCQSCRKRFTVTTGTALHATKLPLHHWAQAKFLILTQIKINSKRT